MWPLLIMAGASMLQGYLQSKSQKKQTSTSTSTSTPTFSPEMSPLIHPLVSSSLSRMSTAGLPFGYEALGIDAINKTYNTGLQGLQNRLTSQGLGGSPIAGSGMAALEAGRLGQIAGFRTELPLVQQQMQDQANRQAMAVLGLGHGQTTTGTGTTIMGDTNPMAASFGEGLGDVANMMAWLSGKGYFKQQPKFDEWNWLNSGYGTGTMPFDWPNTWGKA